MSKVSKKETLKEEINRRHPISTNPMTVMVAKDEKIYVYKVWKPLFGDLHRTYRRLVDVTRVVVI